MTGHAEEPITLSLLNEKLDAIAEEVASKPGGIMTETAAARALPLRDSAAFKWLRTEGLVADIDGRAVVVWEDVVDRLRAQTARRAERRRGTNKTGGEQRAPNRVEL